MRVDQSHRFLKFYPILSYVELTLAEPDARGTEPDPSMQPIESSSLPSTDTNSAHEAWRIRTDSVKKAFAWFRKQKVQRILNLKVVDDSTLPCSDDTIEECLRDFDIRFLNWNKDDFCVEILYGARLFNVKELWLSWSGRNSVLYSWSCKDSGLPTLRKVAYIPLFPSTSGCQAIPHIQGTYHLQ